MTQRKLLILDLDETLAYATESPLDRDSDFRVGPFFVYKRPFLDAFLTTSMSWFDFAVWSSATSDYVAGIVSNIFPSPTQLRFTWAREKCTRRLDPDQMDYTWLKNLSKVKRLGFNLDQVLMLDDSPEKLQRNYGNHLHLRPFVGDPADTELCAILPALKWLHGVDNVRAVEKRDWRVRFPLAT